MTPRQQRLTDLRTKMEVKYDDMCLPYYLVIGLTIPLEILLWCVFTETLLWVCLATSLLYFSIILVMNQDHRADQIKKINRILKTWE